jgi:hypothetical protein
MLTCGRCGKPQHVCAQPGCGHSKFENHGGIVHGFAQNGIETSACNFGKHGAVIGCHCAGYLESEEERVCRQEAEEEQRWPEDAINMLREVCGLQHHSNPLRPKLLQLLALGEKLVAEDKIVIHAYK